MARTKDTDATAAKPKKQGRIKQMVEVFKVTQEADRSTLPWMIGALVASIVVLTILSKLILGMVWYGIFLGIAVGLLAAMFILARKAESAAFNRIKGQSGAPLAAMQSIRRGWNVDEEPVQMDPRSQKMLFRASGRAGVAIVTEDGSGPSMKMLDKETRRVKRVLNNEPIPIHRIVVGDGEDQIPLHKLPSYMTRMKKTLTKDESAAVGKRLAALTPSLRTAVPKGIDPTRQRGVSKKAMMRGGR
jgi:hypothetical protein